MAQDVMPILQPCKVLPRMTERQIADLRKAFSQFDRNSNGYINIRELQSALTRLGVDASLAQSRRMIDFALYWMKTEHGPNHHRHVKFEEWVEATHVRFENMQKALRTVDTQPPRAPIERYQESGSKIDPGGLIGGVFKVKKKQTTWNLAK